MATVSIKDFTVTVDTEASGGDKLVLHLDREGQPRLSIACGTAQLMWIIEDPDHFTNGYRSSLARNIVACHKDGWTYEVIARELGITTGQAVGLHNDAVAAAEAAVGAGV
jgi:hypothetical protein